MNVEDLTSVTIGGVTFYREGSDPLVASLKALVDTLRGARRVAGPLLTAVAPFRVEIPAYVDQLEYHDKMAELEARYAGSGIGVTVGDVTEAERASGYFVHMRLMLPDATPRPPEFVLKVPKQIAEAIAVGSAQDVFSAEWTVAIERNRK